MSGNDPRGLMAVGMVTAILHGDQEGFLAATDEFDGGCAEALAALGQVTVAIVRMVAQQADPPMTPEQVWEVFAQAIALGPD